MKINFIKSTKYSKNSCFFLLFEPTILTLNITSFQKSTIDLKFRRKKSIMQIDLKEKTFL